MKRNIGLVCALCLLFTFIGTSGDASDLVKIQSLGVGPSHTCALDSNGTVWCWGYNVNGQLGLGDTNNRLSPQKIGLPAKSLRVFTTGVGTLTVLEDGSNWVWGGNANGELGVGDKVDHLLPVRLNLPSPIVDVQSSYDENTCVLLQDHTLWCAGTNFNGQLGTGDTIDRPVFTQVQFPSGLGDLEAFQVNWAGGCAHAKNGEVWCWGSNMTGQIGTGDMYTEHLLPTKAMLPGRAIEFQMQDFHSCAVLDDRSVWCWGVNREGQVGVDLGEDVPSPVKVLSGPVRKLALGYISSMVLLEDGTVWAWGQNNNFQLGIPNPMNQTKYVTPHEVTFPYAVANIVKGASRFYGQGTLADGSYCAWGANQSGQLGLGNMADQMNPVAIIPYGKYSQIFYGPGNHSCALTITGLLKCWGENTFGQLGYGDTQNRGVNETWDELGFLEF